MGDDSVRCAVVLSTADVWAPASLEPSEEALQAQTTAILTEALQGDNYQQYLPPQCMF